MTVMLTERQAAVLRFFRDYRREMGISPTLEEAAQALGVNRITVHEHLRHLETKGAIRRTKGKSRTVAILFDPDEADARDTASIPLVGRIRAGQPLEAVEDREDVAVEQLIPTGEQHYLLEVQGDSMIEDHIADGDLIVVEKRSTARNGDIVVAILEDESATLKRFYRESDGRYRLQPANSALSPIVVDQLEIRGVVKGVVRRFR